jgi:hypothetical protein
MTRVRENLMTLVREKSKDICSRVIEKCLDYQDFSANLNIKCMLIILNMIVVNVTSKAKNKESLILIKEKH